LPCSALFLERFEVAARTRVRENKMRQRQSVWGLWGDKFLGQLQGSHVKRD
jgi:hypothetical protein